jgi:DNA-binding NarL/FixJ family response regulator
MRDEVLWVDDDSPKTPRIIDRFHVVPVQSCRQADDLLASKKIQPAFIIMDLILPQDGWGSGYIKLPGLAFIEYLRAELGSRVVVYTIATDADRRSAAIRAGASEVYEKTKFGFIEILRDTKLKMDRDGVAGIYRSTKEI